MTAGGAAAVLMVAAGLPWEGAALTAIDGAAGVVLLRRCMDVTDLLAHAAAGDARVAVVAAEAPGLDRDAVTRLRREGVEPLVVTSAGHPDAVERLRRGGVRHVLADGRIATIAEAIRLAAADGGATIDPPPAREITSDPGVVADLTAGRGVTVAVWGPAGAPGRTTIALGLASELAVRGSDPLLIDADPWGGVVAQRLAVLDEVSGLLAAGRVLARGAAEGEVRTAIRRVNGLRVLTGLPRADRWQEASPDILGAVLASEPSHAVIDTGFSLEEDLAAELSGRPGRNALTHAALAAADVVLVVGTPDPVGVARLARALDEAREVTAGQPVHVVLNRWRPRLGIDEAEVRRLLSGFADVAAFHVVPDDPLAADRSLATGRMVHEAGPSPLARSFGPLADALFPAVTSVPAAPPRRGLRRRTAAAARPQ